MADYLWMNGNHSQLLVFLESIIHAPIPPTSAASMMSYWTSDQSCRFHVGLSIRKNPTRCIILSRYDGSRHSSRDTIDLILKMLEKNLISVVFGILNMPEPKIYHTETRDSVMTVVILRGTCIIDLILKMFEKNLISVSSEFCTRKSRKFTILKRETIN